MIERVFSKVNIRTAYRQVVSNKGSAGVDGMSVNDLLSHLQENWKTLEWVVSLIILGGQYGSEYAVGTKRL